MEKVLQIVPICLSIAALIYTAVSFRRTANKDNGQVMADRARMEADIRYIRDSVDDIKLQYKSLAKDLTDLRDRVITVEASAKSAHKRMDDYVKQHGAETNRYQD